MSSSTPVLTDRVSRQASSRRRFLAWAGTALLAGVTGCSGTATRGGGADASAGSSSPPAESVFEAVAFSGPTLVVTLAEEHDVTRLNLIAPDGSTFRQTTVAEGATQIEIQIVSKTGSSYSVGEYDLVAVTDASSESMTVELKPEIQVVDVKPEFDEDDGYSSGRLLVAVENVGTGPTWVYNIGFQNAPYRNAPQVIDGVADTTFERPTEGDKEFLSPQTQRTFLKQRGVLVISDSDDVSCTGDTAELTVVVQTPHGDTEQPIRAQLSGGYHIDDQGAIQHPCRDVQIELVREGDQDAE